jgi:hypothetical protein
VLNGTAQVLFDGTVRVSTVIQYSLYRNSARIMDNQAAGNAARYKTNSLSKGRSRNAISFKTACHGGDFVSTVRRAAPPTAGDLAVVCTTRRFAISHLSDT